MGRIDELISEQCSNGVPYASLGDCLVRTKGTKITADQMQQLHKENAPVKIFAGGKTVAYFDYKDLPEKDIQTNPSIIVKSRGLVEFEYYDGPFSHKNEFWAYHSKNNSINIKYVYYYLKNQESYFRSIATSMGSLPQIAIPITDNFRIPIPPIAIQEEIVRILDNFTELSARENQYEYYLNHLLSFADDIKRKTLGEVCNLSAGGDVPKDRYSKIKTEKYCIPIYSNGINENALYGYTDTAKIIRPSVTISARGTIGYSALRVEPFYPIIRLICAVPKKEVTPEYLLYAIQTIKFQVPATGIPQLTVPMVSKYEIPVPSLDEQIRIVNILDRFSTLCNSITIGLPAEINARRKQYEYYRDKLLTFQEA